MDKGFCPIAKADCVGHKCMMYRFLTVEQAAKGLHEGIRLEDGVGYEDKGETYIEEWPNSEAKMCGYCGLAGAPLAYLA